MANTADFKTGYKITDKYMTCNGFRFKLNEWYSVKGELKLCQNGFHFCEYPSGPWSYYKDGRLFEVEAKEVLLSSGPGADIKHVARHIRLIKEIKITGYMNTGNTNTGYRNTGDMNTGNRNTGDTNTGYRNTGNMNTGNRNTGNTNTGYRNTGNMNTGNRNTGEGNCGNDHSGSLCFGPAPFYLFNKKTDRKKVDFDMVYNLSCLLLKDNAIDPGPFLSLPNATKSAIKKLHMEHIKARRNQHIRRRP